MTRGKSVLIGVTGGIAAYKAAALTRLFKKNNWNVIVAMTQNAMEFVTPLTFETLSGNPVITDTFDRKTPLYGTMEHITLADTVDAFVCAPATANIIAKIAGGIADDILSTTILALKKETPKIICPAMNVRMYENPATQDNMALLKKRGFFLLEPEAGELACGVEGKGRLPKEEVIFAQTLREISGKPLNGKRFLVTGGATMESLDPVRYITNHSSGKMGVAVAEELWKAGAEVSLISGKESVPSLMIPQQFVQSVEEMKEAVLKALRKRDIDLVIMAAAVSDYTPARYETQKIKKEAGDMTLKLKRTPDIIESIRNEYSVPIIGFAAESENIEENARMKLKNKGLLMVVANDITQTDGGFRSDYNRCYFITGENNIELSRMTKQEIGARLAAFIADYYSKKR
jgi:phosphopantothenoylcysteine decarboxylase/phosphopantothenate--cysteine ligase